MMETRNNGEMTKEQHTDEAIIDGLLRNDEEMQRLFVRYYRAAVEGECKPYFETYHGGGYDEARDAAQEVYLKVFDKIGTFDRSKNFKAWVLGIARNTCIDILRKDSGEIRQKKRTGPIVESGNCDLCGSPVYRIKTTTGKLGKRPLNRDGMPHKSTCAASPTYNFPKYSQIQRSKKWEFTGMNGRAEPLYGEEKMIGGEKSIEITEAWDRINRHVAISPDDAFRNISREKMDEDKAGYRETIQQVLYERGHELTKKEKKEVDMFGFYLYLYGDPPEEVESGNQPEFLYEMDGHYICALYGLTQGLKMKKVCQILELKLDTTRKYFERMAEKHRKGINRYAIKRSIDFLPFLYGKQKRMELKMEMQLREFKKNNPSNIKDLEYIERKIFK